MVEIGLVRYNDDWEEVAVLDAQDLLMELRTVVMIALS